MLAIKELEVLVLAAQVEIRAAVGEEDNLKLLLYITVLLFAFSVNAQSPKSEAEELYFFVTENYLGEKSDSVAKITKPDLYNTNMLSDYRYYALNLIARSNRKHGNFQRAIEIANSIPVDSIQHQPTMYDTHFLRAWIYLNSKEYFKADSIYSKWLNRIPDEYPLIKTINYNDFVGVKEFFQQSDSMIIYLKKAIAWNQKTNDDRKLHRSNVYLKNLSNYYVKIEQPDSAFYYHSQIDTTGASIETKITFELSNGKINKELKKFDEAYNSYMIARNQASLFNFEGFFNEAKGQANVVLVLKEKHVKQRWLNVTQVVGFLLLLLILKYIKVFKRIRLMLISSDTLRKEFLRE